MDGSTLTVPAPAKLNLFLHVTGRRPDGYHTLESLMVMLDFGDTLTLSARDDGAVVLTHPLPGVPVETDLVYRAATLLQKLAAHQSGVTITVEKRVPMG
ncbi:MAG: 4-(cytidine 5'-diphospho)-2-C-methyl-D-erythritol kinase, partial [Betaproteobacteria bacterium]